MGKANSEISKKKSAGKIGGSGVRGQGSGVRVKMFVWEECQQIFHGLL